MNAIQILRQMHADTKLRFKLILGSVEPKQASEQWHVLQPLLDLHERLEDDFVYTPLAEEMGPGTPLGDWPTQHDADVATVRELIQAANQLTAGTPEWLTTIGTIMDVLSKHVTDEEGQIFGRIEQIWSPQRLEEVGQRMQQVKDGAASGGKARVARAKSGKR